MHYLIVTPTPPFPTVAGNRASIVKTLQQIKAAGHRVSLLYSIQEDLTNDSMRAMLGEVDALYVTAYDMVIKPQSLQRAIIRVAAEGKGLNYKLDDWHDPHITKMMEVIYARDPFDVVLNNYIWTSQCLVHLPEKVIKIQQTHDGMSERLARLARLGLGSGSFSVTAEDEGRGLSRANINIAVQYEEELAFRSLTKSVVCTLQHVPEDLPFRPLPIPQGRKIRVGYLGSDNSVNIESLRQLIDCLTINPAVTSKIELHVAGHVSRIITAPPDYVKVHGPLDDTAAFYGAVDMIVNPDISGTGLKIKSVEALQNHLPLVTTKTGSSGLLSPYHFHRCDSIDQMVGYLKLIADDPQNLALMQYGGRYVLNAYQHRFKQASRYLLSPREMLNEVAARRSGTENITTRGKNYAFFKSQTNGAQGYAFPPAPLLDCLDKRLAPKATWLDIGSHYGEFALLAGHAGGAGKVIVVEADPGCVERLKDNVFANKAENIIDMEFLYYAAGEGPGYGVLKPQAAGGGISVPDETTFIQQATVPVASLDDLLDPQQVIDFININVRDAQDILAGLKRTVAAYRPLILVHHTTSDESLRAWMSENNYAVDSALRGILAPLEVLALAVNQS